MPILFIDLLCKKLMEQGVFPPETHLVHQKVRCKIYGSLILMCLQHEFDLILTSGSQFLLQKAFHMRHKGAGVFDEEKK